MKAVLAACAHAGDRRGRLGKPPPQSGSKKTPKNTIVSFFQQKSTKDTELSVDDVLSHGAEESEGCQMFLKNRSTRTSKIKLDGADCWEKLLAAHRDRNKGSAKAADACLDAMVSEYKKDRLQTKKVDSDKRRARTVADMETLLMSGDILWAQSVLVRFNSRPVAVELRKSSPALFSSSRLQTKEEQVGAMFVNQLRDFVATLTETKGKRTKDDQNALDVVLAAMIHPSVFGMKLGRTVQNLLGVMDDDRPRHQVPERHGTVQALEAQGYKDMPEQGDGGARRHHLKVPSRGSGCGKGRQRAQRRFNCARWHG